MLRNMLRNIALTATGLAFCLFMFFYLLNRPEYPPPNMDVMAVAPASVAVEMETPTPPQPTPSPTVAPVAVEAPPTATPSPVPVERQLEAVLANNRGIATPVSISRMMDTITVRWALNDRADVVADADTQIQQALGLIGDEYRLINFEGTFGLVYPDGRRSEDVVLWVTYEDGREVSRKVAPVLEKE